MCFRFQFRFGLAQLLEGQNGCSRQIYVIKLSLSLHSTLGYQEVSASNGLYLSLLKSMGSLYPFILLFV